MPQRQDIAVIVAYAVFASLSIACLFLIPALGVVLLTVLLVISVWARWLADIHIYKPSKFDPLLYRRVGMFAVLNGTRIKEPFLNLVLDPIRAEAFVVPLEKPDPSYPNRTTEVLVKVPGMPPQTFSDLASAVRGIRETERHWHSKRELSELLKPLSGETWEVPTGVVTRIDKVEQFWPDYDYALRGVRELNQNKPLTMAPSGDKDAAVEIVSEDRPTEAMEHADKVRLIKTLLLWFAVCWILAAVSIRVLGGPHGDWSYSRARHFFWWDSFEVSGIVWFATTFIYSLLTRGN